MHRNRWILALGGVLGFGACGGMGDAEPAARSAVNDSPLIATLTTDQPVYAPGEPVTLALTLRNSGAAPQTLEYASAQRYDFAIADAGGTGVWRWSVGQMFAQMLGEETLAAGDSVTYREPFTGRLAVGSYRATGTVVRMGDAMAATTQFQVR